MLVLGLESSCDETAAAVVEGGTRVLGNAVASQVDVHARYGGVVPELASRAHVANVIPVVDQALSEAGLELSAIEAVAATRGPGLVGALLIALQAGKAIAFARQLPFIGVHHLEGHLSAVYLEPNPPPFPHLALVVSGGHTSLIRVDDHGRVRSFGATRDDAAGEAFDKVAKLLGLGYPGGAAIDRIAASGDPSAIAFPRAMTRPETRDDFSFSGLKTAALNWVREHGVPPGGSSGEPSKRLADLCASFQAAVVEVLVRKTRHVARREGIEHVQVCGGVAANSALRSGLEQAGSEDGFRVYAPPLRYCTDNAAMIAAAGHFRLARGERSDFSLSPVASLALESSDPGPAGAPRA